MTYWPKATKTASGIFCSALREGRFDIPRRMTPVKASVVHRREASSRWHESRGTAGEGALRPGKHDTCIGLGYTWEPGTLIVSGTLPDEELARNMLHARSERSIPQSTGINAGSSVFFSITTRNLAGLVMLAFRPTVWMSFGPSWKVWPGVRVTSLPPFTPITIEPSST